MSNKYTATGLYAAVIVSVLVASVFAISYIQEALAQRNQTSGGSNETGSGNKTGGAAGSNKASGNATGGGTAANPRS